MSDQVDMYYRFTWDTEPTDEQLQVIMQEVCEKVKQEEEEIFKIMHETIRKEIERLKQIYDL
jgi:hypothetical protein